MRVTIVPEVIYQELDNEVVLLNMANESYYMLDDIGTRIWQLLSEDNDVAQVISQMLNEYDVSEAQLRQDVNHLVDALTQAGLILREAV